MPRRCLLGGVSLALCAVAALLFVQHAGPEYFEEILSRQGMAAYAAVVATSIPLLLPAPALEILAGATFPLPWSMLVNYVGSTCGCFTAFLLGRFLFRESVLASIRQDPKLQRIDRAFRQPHVQLQIAFFLRLSPVVPDTWLNYVLAAGPVNIPIFLVSTCAAEVVYACMYACYGSVGHSLDEGVHGFAWSTQGKLTIAIGLFATVAAAWILARLCSRLLREAVDENERPLLPT